MHHGVPQPRARIAFLFWPDTSDSQAQTNLRQLLHAVRQRLPAAEAHIDFGDRTIHWRADSPAAVDLLRFDIAVKRAAREEAPGERIVSLRAGVDAYGGELLPGSYSDWLLAARERLAQQYATLLEQLVDLHEARRAYAEAIACAQRLLTHDPLHERTYRVLMRLHALTGDRAAALRVYHTCASMLVRELGVEPSPATRELYERLVSTAGEAVPPSPAEASIHLVGRQPEWQALQGAWRAAARGGVRCVVLSGEAGIGKTRLGAEFLTWLELRYSEAVRLVAFADPQVTASPFGVAADALTRKLSSSDSRGEIGVDALMSMARNVGCTVADGDRAVLARLVGLPSSLVHTRGEKPPSHGHFAQRCMDLLEELAERVAELTTIVVFIEDMHWCDAATLELCERLMQRARDKPIFIVGFARPELLRERPELVEGVDRHVIELEALHGDDVGELLERVLGGVELGGGAADACEEILG
ncbi:MAG: AAA family ATPase, partial [Caldilineaceae bacterium]|nr:AAA family ATPase [Caldilineaceae bacterium]